jgi:hypothetical protein
MCFGPLTDIASAILMNPQIENRLTVICIGGEAYPDGGYEFNFSNDVNAAAAVFHSNVPLWQIPRNAYMQTAVSLAELEWKVLPCGRIGKYLFEQLSRWALSPFGINSAYRTGECWCLGDSAAIGVVLFEDHYGFTTISAPEISEDMHYIPNQSNRKIRVYNRICSRFLLEDFFAKLDLIAKNQK